MHIAIDYTAAVRQGAGIGRYTRNLIGALAEIDSENQYTLFVAGGWRNEEKMGALGRNFRVRAVPLTDRLLNILWQRIRVPIPIQVITGKIDLFHSPDFVLPPVGQTPTMLTVHDLSFLRVPEHFVPGFKEYLEGAVSRAVRKAQHILADSESTKRDLMELLGVNPSKVTVIYPGVDARFTQIRDPNILSTVMRRYELPAEFILGLGTLQPRKNFEGLIDSFAKLVSSSETGGSFAGLHLVICGGPGWMHEEIAEAVERHGLTERVHFPGFVRDEDLPAIYSLASVFAFPSWYEGFGLPVLEAQACGTPVVVADNSSLPEVVGDGGLLVSAGNSDELAHAISLALTDSRLRARLISAGRAQAELFSWSAAAQALLAAYRSVFAQPEQL